MSNVNIGSGFIRISKTWEDFKEITNAKRLSVQYEETSNLYTIFAIDETIVYTTLIYRNTIPESVSSFDQTTNDANKDDFEENFKSTANKSLTPPGDDERRLLTVLEPRVGTELILVTHNFCDPTTWYSDSARTDEVLSDSGDGLTFSGSHVNWIDMVHGRVFDSAALALEAPHEYAVVVVVDNVTASMREPYATSGGEYVVNYASGSITCVSGTWSGKAVRAAYSYAQSSRWKLLVDPGRRIDIEQAEAQFSSDVIMNDTIDFEVWVYNPYDLPNKFRYLLTSYPRFSNFIDEALGSYPVIPPIGGSARGTRNPIYGFPFRYGTIRKLSSAQGAELHVKLKNDKAFGGEHATATFYCTVRND